MTFYQIISKTAIFILFIALTSCGESKKVKNMAEETEILPEDIVELRDDQQKLAGIEMGTIESRPMNGQLKTNGIVGVPPQNLATVSMPLGGFVKSTSLMPGNTIKKGQTLAILESQDFVDIQQNYLEAKNKFEYAEAEYKRHNELYEEDVYSKDNLQQVTAGYKNLKAQLKALEQKLKIIGIDPENLHEDNITSSVALVSPISGYISAVNVNIGKFVAPSDVLFEIVNSDKLFLELTLFEKDVDKVSGGQTIIFFINNETEQHQAKIYQTGKRIGNDKTYKVYASIQADCKNILPGMYVNAIIETEGDKVTAVPSEAVVSFDDKDYIFIFSKNKEEDGKPFTEYRMLEVSKGISDDGYTEIALPENFDMKQIKVVIRGAYNLLSAKKNAGEMAC